MYRTIATKARRALTAILAAVMTVALVPLSAHAAWPNGETPDNVGDEVEIAWKSSSITGNTYIGYVEVDGVSTNGGWLTYTYYNYRDPNTGAVSERPVYCYAPRLPGIRDSQGGSKNQNSPATYKVTSFLGDKNETVFWIMRHGYPSRPLATLGLANELEGYAATKAALWAYIGWNADGNGPGVGGIVAGAGPESSEAKARVIAAAKSIYQNAMAATGTSITEAAVEIDLAAGQIDNSFTLNGSSYEMKLRITTTGASSAALSWASTPLTGAKILDGNTRAELTSMTVTTSGAGYADIIVQVPQSAGQYPALPNLIATIPTPASDIFFMEPVDYPFAQTYVLVGALGGEIYDDYTFIENANTPTPTPSTGIPTPSITPPPPPGGGDFIIVKNEAGTNIPIAGVLFEVYDNRTNNLVWSGRTGADGTAHVDFAITPGMYRVVEIESDPSHIIIPGQSQQIIEVQLDDPELGTVKPTRVTFSNKRRGELRVIKTDASGTALQGARIRIRNISTGDEFTAETKSGGIAVFENLLPGAYEVVETSAPKGYIIDPTTLTVDIPSLSDTNGIPESVQLVNKLKGSLRVIKTDENGSPLDGAVVQIRHVETGAEYTETTRAGGIAQFDELLPGAYVVSEVSAPAGYIIDPSSVTVNVPSLSDTGRPVSVSLVNKSKPGLRIMKLDKQTQLLVNGVTFEIYRDTQLIGTYVTGIDGPPGEILLTDILPGIYMAKEIDVPPGYILDPTPQSIRVDAGMGIMQLIFLNSETLNMKILKLDSKTMRPIGGVNFRIRKIDNTYDNSDHFTDGNGEIDISFLQPGAYEISELSTPSGYIQDNPVRYVELVQDAPPTSIVFTNTPLPDFELFKRDARTGQPLDGVTYRIAKIEDGTRYLDRTTSNGGRIYIEDMEPGVYSIVETAASHGYILDTTEYHVELFPGRTSTLVLDNNRTPIVIVWKYDLETAQPLPNAEFSIRHKDGAVIKQGITDSEGKFVVGLEDGLEPGYYTVTELAPPPGYLLASPPSRDVYLEAGKTLEVKFDNLKCPTLTIVKLDSVTHDPIKNVRFNIRFSPDVNFTGGVTDLGNYTTDIGGRIVLDDNLKAGWYRVSELEPAKGYALKEPVTQDIYLRGGENKTLTFENIPLSALIIRKIDNETGLPVSGATFSVKYLAGTSGSGGTTIFEGVTSTNGTIVLTALQAGTYVVEETSPAPGYELSNPAVQTAFITGEDQDIVTLTFSNAKMGGLVIKKLDSVTKQPIKNVTFKVTDSGGGVIGPTGGEYVTDAEGLINIAEPLPIGSTVIVQEIKCPDNYVIDTTEQSVKIKENTLHTLTFYNIPKSGLQILKLDADTRVPIPNTEFAVSKMNGERIGVYTTDIHGQILIHGLDAGWYAVIETRAAKGYLPDAAPRNIEVKSGRVNSITITNSKAASIILRKIDSVTNKGIYGVVFLLSDENRNPTGEYTSDQDGYVRIDDALPEGKYYLREIKPADGYYYDDTVKTVYITGGKTTEITWKNTPKLGQIQITKLSGDDNEQNGFPKGTPLAGAVFEIYEHKSGNLADRIVSGVDGRAVSKPIPLGRYVVKEVQAPVYYMLSTETMDITIEFATQIVKRTFVNFSSNTGVTIRKTGSYETMPGNEVFYTIKEVRNDSTVPLTDFYWRDVLPTDAVRLQKIVTGTYSQSLKYKILATTNKGDTKIIADNLSTTRNNVIDCSAAALGLASDEYITRFSLLFGMVKAGFTLVEQPRIYVKVLPNLPNGYEFANKADCGGKYGSEWVVGNSVWRTGVYSPAPQKKLPRTGY
jgi:TQXA domain-containing protein